MQKNRFAKASQLSVVNEAWQYRFIFTLNIYLSTYFMLYIFLYSNDKARHFLKHTFPNNSFVSKYVKISQGDSVFGFVVRLEKIFHYLVSMEGRA